jgi:hypothetical protein
MGVSCEPAAADTTISASANHSSRIVRYFLRTLRKGSVEQTAAQSLNCLSA